MPSWSRVLENHKFLQSLRGTDFQQAILKTFPATDRARITNAYKAEGFFLKGYDLQLQGAPYTAALQFFDQAIKTAPWSQSLRNQISAYLVSQFRDYYAKQEYSNALELLKLRVEIHPESAIAHEDYGMMLFQTQQPDAAVFELQKALQLDSDLIFARRVLGEIYMKQGLADEAFALWQEVLNLEPNDVKTLTVAGTHLARQGVHIEAQRYLQKAYRLASENPSVINGYAEVMYLAGDVDTARGIVHRGNRYYEGNPSFESMRTKILQDN